MAALITARDRRRNAVVAFLTVATVVPVVWMVMDRDPPYRRSGEIVAAEPRNCDLPEPPAPPAGTRAVPDRNAIRAGGCIEVKWSLEIYRACPGAGRDNVTRHLRDSLGITKPIGSLRSLYGGLHEVPVTGIRNFLTLPSPMPAGPAVYISSACFACNPLQQVFWPVCVDEPDIHFIVEK